MTFSNSCLHPCFLLCMTFPFKKYQRRAALPFPVPQKKKNERTEGDLLNGLKVYKFKLKKEDIQAKKMANKINT